jgi:hypothetical protein
MNGIRAQLLFRALCTAGLLAMVACTNAEVTVTDQSSINQSPGNSAPVISASCSTAVNQDVVYSCAPTFTDADGDSVLWVASVSHSCSWLSVDSTTGAVSGTANDDQVGSCTVAFSATDGVDNSNEISFSVTVNNLGPALSIGDAATSEDTNGVIRTDAAVAANEEGFGTYSLNASTANAPACGDNGSVTINTSSGETSFTPNANYNGVCYINVRFDDGNGGTADSEFALTVAAVNDAPSAALTYPNGGELLAGGSLVNIIWTASDDDFPANPINIHYSTDGSIWTAIALGQSNTGTYAWTVPSIDSSTVKVRITADDGTLQSADSSDANFSIDATVPIITSITSPANGVKVLSENLDFEVQFSESIAITSTPRIAITIAGPTTVYADYHSMTAGDRAKFRYSVAAGHNDYDGIVLSSPIDLNTTGTIKDAAGNDASLTFSTPTLSGQPNLTGIWINTASLCTPPFTFYDNLGAGTALDPYLICNKTQLNNLGSSCGPTPTGCDKAYKLESDIDLTIYTGSSFNLIGTNTNRFTGTFNGNGHKISNLTYSSAADRIGLFRMLGTGASISDLTLENFSITGQNYVGALLGGGVGFSLSNVGIIKTNVFSNAARVGGLAGDISTASIYRSYFSGNVKGASSAAGGLLGSAMSSSIRESFSIGSVTSTANVGGLVGLLWNSDLEDCYTRSHPRATSFQSAGLIGENFDDSSTSNFARRSYAVNTPWAPSSSFGFTGIYNTIGGGLGNQINNNFFDTAFSGILQPAAYGTWTDGTFPVPAGGITAEFSGNMQMSSTYLAKGWDFTTIWEIVNGSYPTLQNNPEPPMQYATLNPGYSATSGVTFSNGYLTAIVNNGSPRAVQANVGKNMGKWYFEVTLNSVVSTASQKFILVGLGRSSAANTMLLGFAPEAWSCSAYNDGLPATSCHAEGTETGVFVSDFTSTTGVSSTVGIAVDLDAGNVWYRVNGTWQNTGDPSSGTGPIFTGVTGTVFPMASATYTLNTTMVFNFGQSPWHSTPPAGFLGWSQ